MKTAVVVTTYNRPDALAVVLEGYCGQSDHAFDLIVADDGSGKRRRRLCGNSPDALRFLSRIPGTKTGDFEPRRSVIGLLRRRAPTT